MAAEPGDRATVRELGSLVGCLRSTSLAELPDARVEEDFLELHRSMKQLEVERLRRLGGSTDGTLGRRRRPDAPATPFGRAG